MAYIKAKKVWKNLFTKEEIKEIFNAFKANSLAYNKEWSVSDKSQFIEITTKYGLFIHPETDLEDNSMGIQPEQIKRFAKSFDLANLEILLFVLNISVQRYKVFQSLYKDSDGFIVWENIWNDFVKSSYHNDMTFKQLLNSVIRKLVKKTSGMYAYTDSFFNEIVENPFLIIYAFDNNWKNKYKIVEDNVNLLEQESFNKFFIEKSGDWKKTGIKPKSKILQAARAKNFSKESLIVIEAIFGNKNIAELSMIDQYYAVSLIDFFGQNIKDIPLNLLEKGKLNILIGVEENYLENVSNIKEIISMFGELLTLQQFFNYTKYFKLLGSEFVSNLTNEENRDLFKETFNLYIELEESNCNDKEDLKNFLVDIKPRWLKYVRRFYKKAVTIANIRDLFNIWKIRSNNQLIPVINGKVNSYSYSLMDKTIEKESLFLGFATDCCQVPTMDGVACMRSGLSNPEESFFSVTKKGKIYAQSWIWTGTDSKGRKFICFDSIEVLGKDLAEMPDILKCYKELCKTLYEKHNFDYAITGADGEKIPNGLSDYCVKKIEQKDFAKKGIIYNGSCTYTDINELGIYIFDKKKG